MAISAIYTERRGDALHVGCAHAVSLFSLTGIEIELGAAVDVRAEMPKVKPMVARLNDKWRYAAEKYTSEADVHGSGMLQHDHDIGLVLDFLKANGLEQDTIVWYSKIV